MNLKELLKQAKKYIKKPIPIRAVKMEEDFEVETIEGIIKGKAGDYLVEGVKGELYPCRADIFEETYIPINKLKKGLVFLNDEDMSIINWKFISKYFLRIGDNDYNSMFIEVSVNGDVYRMVFMYPTKEKMIEDKKFIETLLKFNLEVEDE